VLRSIISVPVVLKKILELPAAPKISLKISIRPGNELTAGSLNVLGAVDTFTRKIDLFAGISIVAISLS
jgi:hypothetical protein